MKKVLKKSQKRNFFSKVQKILQNPLLTFFEISVSDVKILNEAKKIFFCLIEGFHVKTITQSDSKKSQKWILDNFLHIRKKFSFSGIFQNFLHPASGIGLNFSEIKKFLKSEHV